MIKIDGKRKWRGEVATAEIVETSHGDKYLGVVKTGIIRFDRKIGTYIIMDSLKSVGNSALRTTMIEEINGDVFKTRNTSYRVRLVSDMRNEKIEDILNDR